MIHTTESTKESTTTLEVKNSKYNSEPPTIRKLIDKAIDLHSSTFNEAPSLCSVAPGRVNVIGEHVDYTGGFVLPMAIEYSTVCVGNGSFLSNNPLEQDIERTNWDNASLRVISGNIGCDIDGKETNDVKFGTVAEFLTSNQMEQQYMTVDTSSNTDSPHSHQRKNHWANYVAGVVEQYHRFLFSTTNHNTGKINMQITIYGDVPVGAGLSSSASIAVATAVFLDILLKRHNDNLLLLPYDNSGILLLNNDIKKIVSSSISSMLLPIPNTKKRAMLCQSSEVEFCNSPCGIMDQFVSSCAEDGKVLLIDCRSLDYDAVPFGKVNNSGNSANGDTDKTTSMQPSFVVCDSHVSHSIADGEYPIRVLQCREAEDKLNLSLRDVTIEQINDVIKYEQDHDLLPEIIYKRARHVVTENARTILASTALKNCEWKTLGKLMNESHDSLKDDYNVSCEEIDELVNIARKYKGVLGSRMTGGGFGGCTVTLVENDGDENDGSSVAEGLMEHMKREYRKKFRKDCTCFETRSGPGARKIVLEMEE